MQKEEEVEMALISLFSHLISLIGIVDNCTIIFFWILEKTPCREEEWEER